MSRSGDGSSGIMDLSRRAIDQTLMQVLDDQFHRVIRRWCARVWIGDERLPLAA